MGAGEPATTSFVQRVRSFQLSVVRPTSDFRLQLLDPRQRVVVLAGDHGATELA